MYVKMSERIDIPLINCRTFVIDNQLRNDFILKRDKLMRERVEKQKELEKKVVKK